MLRLQPLSPDDAADDETRALLRSTARRAGFIPKMQGIMANAPAAIGLYASGNALLSRSSLTQTERSVVFMAASHANGCEYCVAAHSAGRGVSQDVLESLQTGNEIAGDDRLEALRLFVSRLVTKRARLTADELNEFLSAGYEEKQVLDVLTAIALKTLTNYVGHLVDIPIDEEFLTYR